MSTTSPFELHDRMDYSYPQQRSEPWNSAASPMLSHNVPMYLPLVSTIPSNAYYQASQNAFNNILTSMPPLFDDLYRERSYLLNSLQHENLKATQLLRTLTPLEENLKIGYFPVPRRKMKRQVGWLKQRLLGISEQEKAILVQLGQIAYHIQRRERETQVKGEYYYPQTQVPAFSGNFDFNMEQRTHLNPAVSAFQPNLFLPNPVSATIPEWQQHHGDYSWQGHASSRPVEDHHNRGISPTNMKGDDREQANNIDNNRPWVRRALSMNDYELIPSLPDRRTTFSPIPKRLSLPSFPDISPIWRMTDEDRRGSGKIAEELGEECGVKE